MVDNLCTGAPFALGVYNNGLIISMFIVVGFWLCLRFVELDVFETEHVDMYLPFRLVFVQRHNENHHGRNATLVDEGTRCSLYQHERYDN